MKRAIIYGIGQVYENRKYLLPNDIEIVAYADSSREKATSLTGILFEGKKVLMPTEINNVEYDVLYICTDFYTSTNIFEMLKKCKIDFKKIRFLNRIGVADQDWEYDVLADGSIVSKIGKVKIHEKKRTDIDTIVEIFAQHIYAINILPNSIVIDMGMNVGIASLFFAANDNVDKVYGFEPFPDTFQMAKENFNLNDDKIRLKIIPSNVAITDREESIEVAVETDMPGWRSLYVKNDEVPRVEIHCKQAASVVRDIIGENPGKKMILKCDTEGSEFVIFESLASANLLSAFDSIVMEYHSNPGALIGLLKKAGYRYYQNGTNHIGTIVAFNMKS